MINYTNIPIYLYDANNCQLSDSFSCEEIVNASTTSVSQLSIAQNVVDVAQYIRDVLKVPVTVTSAVRDAIHNTEIGGATNSQHLIENATALDIVGKGVVDFLARAIQTKNSHYKKMLNLGLKGLGLYDGHAHIDTRKGNFAFWDKRKNKGTTTTNQNTNLTFEKTDLIVPVAITIATIFLGYTLIKTSKKKSYLND